MRAVTVPEPGGDFAHVDRPIPDPGPESVRIAVDACGVCHGDTAAVEGRPPIDYPRVPGHEIAGTVDAVGDRVTAWEPGETVAVGWHGDHCFDCRPCRAGDFVNCVDEAVTGVHRDGGYAEYTTAPAAALIPVPEALDPVVAGPLACAGLTAYTALTSTSARPGGRVAVQGIGGVGHVAVQFADAFGYETVAVSRGTNKAAAAHDLGADRFVDATATDPAERLRELGGADAVIATAPSSDAMAAVVDGLRPNGELVAVGAPDEPLSVDVPRLLGSRLSVRGWSAGHAGDAHEALTAAVANDVRPWTETYSLDEAATAFDRVRSGTARFRPVLVP